MEEEEEEEDNEDCEELSQPGAGVRGSIPPELAPKIASVMAKLCSVTLLTGDSGLAPGMRLQLRFSVTERLPSESQLQMHMFLRVHPSRSPIPHTLAEYRPSLYIVDHFP